MIKKFIAIGVSDGGMTCCINDANIMYDLHCEEHHDLKWMDPPDTWQGKLIAQRVIDISDLQSIYEWCKDADILRVFWSGHGCLVKKEFAFYMGDGTAMYMKHFLQNFLFPLYKAKEKQIDIIIDTCFSGKARRKFDKDKRNVLRKKTVLNEKFLDVKNPKIKKFTDNGTVTKFPNAIRIMSAATGKQSAFGEFNCSVENGFMADTHGYSLYTCCLASSIYNAMAWATGYKKRNWEYVYKLATKRVQNEVRSLGLRGWLDSAPKTVVPKPNERVGRKASKLIL